MVKLTNKNHSFLVSLSVVLIFHLIVLFLFKRDSRDKFLIMAPPPSHRINKIDFITKEDLERIRHVGIQHGKKNLEQPDFKKEQKAQLSAKPSKAEITAPPAMQAPVPMRPPQPQTPHHAQTPTQISNVVLPQSTPQPEKAIYSSNSHEILKVDAMKSLSVDHNNIAAQKISNFEIRYERPEGVSEDELNSDEKTFYSFYKRSYTSYVSKLYATYENIAVARPQIRNDFEGKHLLVGRVDYDENGNIILIKILKSSDSDDIHYFFEETLKKLVLPNPPKIFVRKKKQFSIYYQVQIN